MGRVISCDCEFVWLFVRTLKRKRRELSTPKKMRSKGQKAKVTTVVKKGHSHTLLVKCTADDADAALQVDRIAFCDRVHVCHRVCVRDIYEKPLELSTPNLVHIHAMR